MSVAELMAAAGLTHGGFYGHFESKEDLAGEACRWAFGRSVERWKRRIAGKDDPSVARAALTDRYLSSQSRSGPDGSCPATSLAGDVARKSADAPIRVAYAAGLEDLLKILRVCRTRGRRVAIGRRRWLISQPWLADGAGKGDAGRAVSDEILAAARDRLNRTNRNSQP